MNKITIIAVGALKNRDLKNLAFEYQKRMKPYLSLKLIETKAIGFASKGKKQAKRQEKEALEKVLHSYPKENIFLLAETGLSFTSFFFASLLKKKDSQDLVFVIAGALGWEEDWAKNYQCLSLSPLTFTHEFARIILLEQIYRGLSINLGKEYHY